MSNQNTQDEMRDLLRVRGIDSKGFGTISKAVMQDRELSIQAKAIYAYFKSYSGAGDTAFPSVKKIMYDLGIKDIHTFVKHRDLLIKFNYIEMEQVRVKGKFSKNVYYIISNPDPSKVNQEEKPTLAECEKTRLGKNPTRKNPHYKNNSIYKNNNTLKNNTTEDQKYVCVDSPILDNELKEKMEIVLKSKVSDKTVEKLLNLHGVEKVNYYLDNFTKLFLEWPVNAIAYLTKALDEEYQIRVEKPNVVKNESNGVYQYEGQRDYAKEEIDLDSDEFFANLKDL